MPLTSLTQVKEIIAAAVIDEDPNNKQETEASWVKFRFFYGPVLMGSVR